ncbi:hypothetical protein [Metabacillus sp. FJAT-52054]|uniref:CsbD family protein n=1 Tax=Metabacillus sediminis TaxID=3117746 RepID=A0ABZ2NF65_9BACI
MSGKIVRQSGHSVVCPDQKSLAGKALELDGITAEVAGITAEVAGITAKVAGK